MPSGLKISVVTNSREYAGNMRIISHELNVGVKRAGREMGKIAMSSARWWSSGPFKQAELTRMDHPYARRNQVVRTGTSKRGRPTKSTRYTRGPIGEKFPNRVNVQSGDFRDKWQYTFRVTPGGSYFGKLTNTSEHAQYLTKYGTRFMIGRRVTEAIMRDVRKKSSHLYHDVLRHALASGRHGGGGWTPTVNVVSAFRKGYSTGAGAFGALGL